MNKKKIFIIFTFLLFLNNCQTMKNVKETMEGKKVSTTDEFLIKKKDPLILPPKYDTLPLPKENKNVTKKNSVEKILKSAKSSGSQSSTSDIENKVLEELRKSN